MDLDLLMNSDNFFIKRQIVELDRYTYIWIDIGLIGQISSSSRLFCLDRV
jgi:hypothetical protein